MRVMVIFLVVAFLFLAGSAESERKRSLFDAFEGIGCLNIPDQELTENEDAQLLNQAWARVLQLLESRGEGDHDLTLRLVRAPLRQATVTANVIERTVEVNVCGNAPFLPMRIGFHGDRDKFGARPADSALDFVLLHEIAHVFNNDVYAPDDYAAQLIQEVRADRFALERLDVWRGERAIAYLKSLGHAAGARSFAPTAQICRPDQFGGDNVVQRAGLYILDLCLAEQIRTARIMCAVEWLRNAGLFDPTSRYMDERFACGELDERRLNSCSRTVFGSCGVEFLSARELQMLDNKFETSWDAIMSAASALKQ